MRAEASVTSAGASVETAAAATKRAGTDAFNAAKPKYKDVTRADGIMYGWDESTGQEVSLGRTLLADEIEQRLDIQQGQLDAYLARSEMLRESGGRRNESRYPILEKMDGSGLVILDKATGEEEPIPGLQQPRGASNQFMQNYLDLERIIRQNPQFADLVEEDPRTGILKLKSVQDATAGFFGSARPPDPAKKALWDQLMMMLYQEQPQVQPPQQIPNVNVPDPSFGAGLELPPGWSREY